MGAFDSRVGRLLDDPQQISYIDPVDRGAKPECRVCRRPAATAGIGALTSRCFSPRFSLRIRASSTEERKKNQRQENPPHLSERLRRTLVFTADTSGAAPFVYLFVGLEFLFFFFFLNLFAICGLTQHSIKERRDIGLSAELWINTSGYHR